MHIISVNTAFVFLLFYTSAVDCTIIEQFFVQHIHPIKTNLVALHSVLYL